MILGVQDGGFLPEGPLDFKRNHTAGRGGKKGWELLSDPRRDCVISDWPLIREGPEFEFDLGMKVSGSVRLDSGVAENQDRRLRLFVELEDDIRRPVPRWAKCSLNRQFERRPNLLVDRGGAGVVEFFPALFELGPGPSGVRPVLPAEAQPAGINGKVDVLGEPLNDAEHLRK